MAAPGVHGGPIVCVQSVSGMVNGAMIDASAFRLARFEGANSVIQNLYPDSACLVRVLVVVPIP
jgi:hypothetical protein